MKGRAIGAMVIGDARFVVRVAVTFGMLLSGVFVQTAHAEKYSIQDIAAVGLGATVEGVNERGEIVGTVPVSPGATRFNGWWYKDGKWQDDRLEQVRWHRVPCNGYQSCGANRRQYRPGCIHSHPRKIHQYCRVRETAGDGTGLE